MDYLYKLYIQENTLPNKEVSMCLCLVRYAVVKKTDNTTTIAIQFSSKTKRVKNTDIGIVHGKPYWNILFEDEQLVKTCKDILLYRYKKYITMKLTQAQHLLKYIDIEEKLDRVKFTDYSTYEPDKYSIEEYEF